MPQQERDAPSRAGRREWIGLAVLALPTLLVALDIGVLFLALPHLSADLGASGVEQLWITDTYGFMLAGFLIIMGTLGDRVGRRRLLLIGAAAFGTASVLAAFAASPEQLIIARGLLGIAGATLSPSTLALITNMFPNPRQRGLAFSLWGACQFGGGALGPVVGGMMLDHFWWGSVFLLGVPVMALLLVLGPVLLPEYRAPGAQRIDLVSVPLSLVSILALVYGIKELAVGGGDSPVPAILAIAAALWMGAVFVNRQRRLRDPLVDPRLFAGRAFGFTLAAMALASGVLAGSSLLTTQYIQSVVGLSPAAAGLWQAPTGIGIAVGVLAAPALVSKVSPKVAILFGLAISATGLMLLTTIGIDDGPAVTALLTALVAFGVGPLFALGTGIAVGSAPPEKAGSAASLSESSNVMGSTLGLAVLGTVGTAIYRSQLVGSAPDGVPASVLDQAKQTIGGAAAVAEQTVFGPGLFDAAQLAFTRGIHVVAVVGAGLMVVVAMLVWASQRRSAVIAHTEEPVGDNASEGNRR
jgi:DHA2 family multidrug resistance protein-like MFS transporter